MAQANKQAPANKPANKPQPTSQPAFAGGGIATQPVAPAPVASQPAAPATPPVLLALPNNATPATPPAAVLAQGLAPTPPAAPTAPATPPAATHHAGIALAALPKNIAQRGATGGLACPPKLAGMVLAPGKPYSVRATHVGLWVQAAVANLTAAGGRATGAALCKPVAIAVPAATAQQYGLQPAPGQPGMYMVQCPGHVLAYVLGGPVVKA